MRVPALSLCAAHGRDTLYGAPRPGGMLPRRAKCSRTCPICYAKSEVLSLKVRPASPRAPRSKAQEPILFATQNRRFSRLRCARLRPGRQDQVLKNPSYLLRKIGGSLAQGAPGFAPRAKIKCSRTCPVCYAKLGVLSLRRRFGFAKRRGLAAAVQGAYSGLRLGLPRVVRKPWRGILEL